MRHAVSVLAVVAGLLSTASARADHSTALAPFGPGGSAITIAGCQAKGLWAIAAPKSSGTGLAPSTYLYTVSAVLGGGETPTCQPVAVTTTVGSDAAVLQWNAVAGAVGYRVYRSDSTASATTLRALVISAGNSVLPPNVSPGGPPCPTVGRADKCVFQDNGGPQDAAQAPVPIAETSQGAAHADANLVQTIDYGSEAFDPAPTSTTAALKSNVLHQPPGFLMNPGAAPTCKLAGAAPSLIGDAATFGSDDVDEDTCPGSTLVGTIQTLAVTPGGPALTEGDIYNGEAKAGELARLLIVLRPLCSAGNLAGSPGSASCNASLGGSGRQVEKSFLAAVARTVDRGSGVSAIDVGTVQAEDDGPIPPYLNVLVPTPSLQRLAKVRLSLQQITLHLFGVTGDLPFLTLPAFCGAGSFSSEITTYTDATPATGNLSFSPTPCEQPPVTPPAGGDDGPVGGGGGGTLPAFGARTLVTLKLAARRIPARGPLRIRVANANGFAITGVLSGKRRVKLKSKAFGVPASAARTVKLALPKALRRVLKRTRRLTLRMTAQVKDPAGHARTVTAKLSPRLKR